MAQLTPSPRPLSSRPPMQDLSRTDSGSGLRSQRLRPVGAVSPSPRPTQASQRTSQAGKGTRGTPPLRHHDSSPDILLAGLPAHRAQDRRSTAMIAGNNDGSAPSSSRPSLNLLDPDTIVQASNPAHPDHYLWLQRTRTNSPISRRKKVPALDPDDPLLTDSSAGPSCGGHSADARASLRPQLSGARLAPSLRGTMLSRPSSSVASLSSSSDQALSVPNTPRTRRKSGDRSPNGTVGSSSDAKAAARKRRRERRERRERRKALASPPPPPVLPPRVSSSVAREEDNLEGLPPLEKAVYPREAISPILPPHPVRTLPIGGRTSSNPGLRASAQAMEAAPPLPLPAKAVRLLGPESATTQHVYLGESENFGRWPAEEPDDSTRFNRRQGRSASLDLLREHLNFFPQRSASQQTSKQSESSGPSRIRASFDALRPHLMTLTRSNGPTPAPEAEVDSDASETIVIKQKPEGKMRKGLRSIKSVLRLRGETAEVRPVAALPTEALLADLPGEGFRQKAQSLDVPRPSLHSRRVTAPSAISAGSISVPLNFRKLDGWSNTDQRLSFVGEEVDGSQLGRSSIESASRTATSATMTPMPHDLTSGRSVSPGLTDSRRLSTGRIAPQLHTVPEISQDSGQNSPRRHGNEQQGQLVEDNRQWQGIDRERSSTEPVKLTGSGAAARPTNRLRHLPSFNSLRGVQTSTTSPPASISAAGSNASSPQYDPASMSRQQGSNGSNGSKGRKGLFTSLWGRGSSTPSSKSDQQSSWLASEQGVDSSAASLGSTAPTPISPTSGEPSLRNVLEQAYTNSYGACNMSDAQTGGRTGGYSGQAFAQPAETTGAMGLGIASASRSGARELSAGAQAPVAPFSTQTSAVASRPTKSVTTPRSAKLSQPSNGAYSPAVQGTTAGPQVSPVPQRSPFQATAAEDQTLDLAFLQADYQHRSALLTGATSHSSQSTKPQVAIATSYEKDAKTKTKKRSPFLEVVAAGRKSFSKERPRQPSNQQQRQDFADQGGELLTIHKTLGPMLLSDADGQRGSLRMVAAAENVPTAEEEDEPWDGMDVEEEGGLRSSTSSGLRSHAIGEGIELRRGASAPSWDSASYRHSPPSPATSPSVSPSSRQREKIGADADQPPAVVFGNDHADTTVGASGNSRDEDRSLLAQSSTPSRARLPAGSPLGASAQAAAQNSLPVGETNHGSFGIRRASLGRHAGPPAGLRLPSSMQEIPVNAPLPVKKETAMSPVDPGLSSSVSFTSTMASPIMPGGRKPSTPLFSGRKFSIGDASGNLLGSAKKSEQSPAMSRTSFSMDRDRSPVASPFMNHASASSPNGKGLRGAFARLGISNPINSSPSSQAMKSMGSTMSTGTTSSYGGSHMKKGISSDSYPFAAFSEETRPDWAPSPFEESRTGNGRPDLQWSHTSRSTSSGNLTGHNSSLSAAQEATQMLQVETEELPPTPSATASTLTAPGRRSSGSLSPSFRGPSMDSEMSRGNSTSREAGSHVHPPLQAASIYGTTTPPSTAALPIRPPRSRPLPGYEGRGASPAPSSHLHRLEGTSSSSGSHATPAPSPRTQEPHDLSALDAMLRAQKAREEEMFKGIMARSRTRTRTEEARCQGAHSPYLLSPNVLSDGRSSAFL